MPRSQSSMKAVSEQRPCNFFYQQLNPILNSEVNVYMKETTDIMKELNAKAKKLPKHK